MGDLGASDPGAVVVVGGGLAGLSAALGVAEAGRRAILLAADPLLEGCASAWAQGGLAAALSPDDAPALHAADTVAAGAGLVDPAAALSLAEDGPETVRRLIRLGAPFDADEKGRLLQSLEAAHSRARVARVGGDGAGRAVMAAVAAAAAGEGRIRIMEGARVLALGQGRAGRIRGVQGVLAGGAAFALEGAAVILATGGSGGLYAVTTNPPAARGAGLVLAALAGATIADPEFIQFHPTAMDFGIDPAPLATEALRGDGARLVDRAARPFMADYDKRGDLAPRDVVARAVEEERRAGRGAFLDARDAVGEHFPELYPAVFAACLRAGLDPRQALIPLAPAAHYHMGGIETDLFGRTGVEGLYAAGECASSGVHGANRLASNSLLEAAAFGRRAGLAAAEEADGVAGPGRLRWLPAGAPPLRGEALEGLRRAMSRGVGVVRTETGLGETLLALQALEDLKGPAPEILAARFIARAALQRRESRGGHHRADWPREGAPRRTRLSLEAVTQREPCA